MRNSLKPALCRLRRNISERQILWDRFRRAKIPHPVMEKSMDKTVKEGRLFFHEKMSLVAAIHRRLFDKNPMSYSLTRDLLRNNGYPSDGNQHSAKPTSVREMPMGNAVKENKLFFLDKMSLVTAIRGRLFDKNPMSYSFTGDQVRYNAYPSDENQHGINSTSVMEMPMDHALKEGKLFLRDKMSLVTAIRRRLFDSNPMNSTFTRDQVRYTLNSFDRKQLCIKFSRILFHETLPNIQRRLIPRLFKFKYLMNKSSVKFDQAIHQELTRIINFQSLLPRCRSMALM